MRPGNGRQRPSPGMPAEALLAFSEVWSKAAVSHFTEEDIAPGEEVAFPGPRVAAMSRAGCPPEVVRLPLNVVPSLPGSDQVRMGPASVDGLEVGQDVEDIKRGR